MDQKQLGARVGTSQNIISLLERGKLGSSSFILPICKVLRIPVPMHFVSTQQQRWALVGHLLEEAQPAQFESALKLFEGMVAAQLKAIEDAQIEEPGLVPVSSASLLVPQKADPTRPVRMSDETGVDALEKKKKRR